MGGIKRKKKSPHLQPLTLIGRMGDLQKEADELWCGVVSSGVGVRVGQYHHATRTRKGSGKHKDVLVPYQASIGDR